MHRSLGLGGGGSVAIRSAGGGGVYDGKIAGLYDLEETLGRGHFAVVKLAKHVFTGEKVAVKVIDKSKLDEVSKAHLFQEVRCMKLVQHPNVVRLYEVIDTATKLYLILELGDGGDLYDYIMRHDAGLSEQLARDYFRQIVKAISYCHRLHVVHRDLKPENVVFFEKLGVVKLTDFGFSNKFFPGQKLETSCGSLAYSAPEILLGDSYDAPAVDVWSLGVILYMLVCGQAPFQEANDSETLTMIMDCKYTVPAHISKDCRDLIARMLVRDPEKRATLVEIAAHPWLAQQKDDQSIDIVPLITREQLSDDDHNLIVQKIVNGNIATKEEIQESIEKNAYNHITATYYLLAERKLKSKRQEQSSRGRRPEHLAVVQGSPTPLRELGSGGPTPSLLTVPRTPGDLPQRSRKCSIVQEDEEEEDLSSCSGREELAPPHNSLNRRGSRSEGRLNLALQERLSESERRKPDLVKRDVLPKMNVLRNLNDDRPKTADNQNKWRLGKSASIPETTSPVQVKIISDIQSNANIVTTNIITEASTISIPVLQTTSYTTPVVQKYKTMPSPTRTSGGMNPQLHLNEIFEEGDGADPRSPHHRQFVSRNQKRTSYEQRRSKFHKNRTASCSSSDASDDDSESRKKRAHKLNNTEKPIIKGRRDSHDDSSDSQEPGTGTGTGARNGRLGDASIITQNNVSTNQESNKTNNTSSNSSTGRKNTGNSGMMIGRRHKTGRRRETRLRESQSLNRITEVQEDPAHSVIINTTVTATHCVNAAPKTKGLGARILQGLNMSGTKKQEDKQTKEEKVQHLSRKDASLKNPNLDADRKTEEKENCKLVERVATKKMRLFGKYFQVHKKLYIPLPGIFSRNRLYKAQSCGSLIRDKISQNPDVIMRNRQRAASVIRNSIGSESDINQNMGIKPVMINKCIMDNADLVALKRHGYVFDSSSISGDSGRSDFDDEYYNLKPPPLERSGTEDVIKIFPKSFENSLQDRVENKLIPGFNKNNGNSQNTDIFKKPNPVNVSNGQERISRMVAQDRRGRGQNRNKRNRSQSSGPHQSDTKDNEFFDNAMGTTKNSTFVKDGRGQSRNRSGSSSPHQSATKDHEFANNAVRTTQTSPSTNDINTSTELGSSGFITVARNKKGRGQSRNRSRSSSPHQSATKDHEFANNAVRTTQPSSSANDINISTELGSGFITVARNKKGRGQSRNRSRSSSPHQSVIKNHKFADNATGTAQNSSSIKVISNPTKSVSSGVTITAGIHSSTSVRDLDSKNLNRNLSSTERKAPAHSQFNGKLFSSNTGSSAKHHQSKDNLMRTQNSSSGNNIGTISQLVSSGLTGNQPGRISINSPTSVRNLDSGANTTNIVSLNRNLRTERNEVIFFRDKKYWHYFKPVSSGVTTTQPGRISASVRNLDSVNSNLNQNLKTERSAHGSNAKVSEIRRNDNLKSTQVITPHRHRTLSKKEKPDSISGQKLPSLGRNVSGFSDDFNWFLNGNNAESSRSSSISKSNDDKKIIDDSNSMGKNNINTNVATSTTTNIAFNNANRSSPSVNTSVNTLPAIDRNTYNADDGTAIFFDNDDSNSCSNCCRSIFRCW
ncbi:hypothetical protein FQR65_LT07697 [Abscondita terminalis]|nr:hypothetical protein FQR65_LT07697 [Abscondita terminalis]